MPQAKKTLSSMRITKSPKGVRGSKAIKSPAKKSMEWSSGSCAAPKSVAKGKTGTRQSRASGSARSMPTKYKVKG